MKAKRILVLGGGAREAAIARVLCRAGVDVHVAPGNAGLVQLASIHHLPAPAVPEIRRLAKELAPSLVVVGPEMLLADGVANALADDGISCLGPTREAAKLETSKEFLRTLASTASIPSPRHKVVASEAELAGALRSFAQPPVVKASGLAAGKGVVVSRSFDEADAVARAYLRGALGDAGRVVVIEEGLSGEEASAFFLCDGKRARFLGAAKDSKRRDDGDRGPNTGGMGAISPHPRAPNADDLSLRFVQPLLNALAARGEPYAGILYLGLMLTSDGPRLLEVNARLGDPEASVLLPGLEPSEFVEALEAAAHGSLASSVPLRRDELVRVAVVVARQAYPARADGDTPTFDAPSADLDGAWIDYAGVSTESDGRMRASGGRVAAVVGQAPSLPAARSRAYEALTALTIRDTRFRTDIGAGEGSRTPDLARMKRPL